MSVDQGAAQRETLLIAAAKRAAAASLAGGIIAASGRQHSLKEALEVLSDVQNAMFPEHGSGHYQAWAANEDRFHKVYR
ncbi:MAG: hypothetical protein ACHP7N_02470 [Caulobacterales bacterium]